MFNKKQRLLLAISGGADSTVLAYLLKKCGFDFALAHCNYGLRGKDSDKDEKFCEELGASLKVKMFVHKPDVKAYLSNSRVSLQMAARDLRYTWFNQLLKQEKFDVLLTAHHANDAIETFFINLMRGTGINGLKGLREKGEALARPLLAFQKKEILAYAKKNKIKFRTDKSNLEDKYERNFIRLNILPLFKSLNEGFEKQMMKNMAHLLAESDILRNFFESKKTSLMKRDGRNYRIDRSELKKEEHLPTLLHNFLYPFGFNEAQCNNMAEAVHEDKKSGQKFFGAGFVIFVERNELVIEEDRQQAEIFRIFRESDLFELPFLSSAKPSAVKSKREFVVDPDRLEFPVTIRPPAIGDCFQPFGMKGKKLVSDFLKDIKVNNSDKKKVRLLVNGNGEIMWVMGHRSDERYRVNMKKKFLKLEYSE